jgi:hypothetical protein
MGCISLRSGHVESTVTIEKIKNPAQKREKGQLVDLKLAGEGEMIRFLLIHANVPFYDIRLTSEEFKAGKANGLYGKGLPIWIGVNSKQISEPNTILQALGRKHGYYSSLSHEIKDIDYVLDKTTNFIKPLIFNILK